MYPCTRNVSSLLTTLALSLSVFVSAASAEPAPDGRSVLKLARDAWSALPNTTLGACAESFDYFPRSGPQQVGCHLFSLRSVKSLLKLSATSVFKSGPHAPQRDEFNLNHPWKFGRYHPDFVKWVSEQVIPAITAPKEVARNQSHYREYLKPFVTALYLTYQKMEGEPECAALEVKRYKQYLMTMRSGADPQEKPDLADMPYERYFYFMNPLFCAHPNEGFRFYIDRGFDAGHNGNVIKGCVSWWLRRKLDGTAPTIWSALKRFVRAYDEPLSRRTYGVSAEAERDVRALLKRFEGSATQHDARGVLSVMDHDYRATQHDQTLKGDTVKFMREFFCGTRIRGQGYTCAGLSDLSSLKLIEVKPPQRTGAPWSVTYHVTATQTLSTAVDASGDTVTTTRTSAFKLSFEVVARTDERGQIHYGIVGAVG